MIMIIPFCLQLDTGRDVSIGLSVEDAALYASIDQDNFLTTSICFCDLDYLDLNVSLLDEPKPSKLHFDNKPGSVYR